MEYLLLFCNSLPELRRISADTSTCSAGGYKGRVAPDFFNLRFFPSQVPTWVADSHLKIFSSFASTSSSYLNLKFDSPLHHA
jgi:hypothetical protein